MPKEYTTEKYTPEELIPPKGSADVGPAINKIMNNIFDYREDEKIPSRCNRYYKMKRNKHWKYKGEELSLLSANLCGTHHKKTVNMVTANAPTFNIVPGGELGEDGEERLSLQKNTAENWWGDTEQQMAFRESVDSGELYGTVGETVYLDLTVDFPHGEVMTDTNDMMYMSMYPPECRQMRKAEAFLKWYKKSVREVRNKYPEHAHEIVGDMSLLEKIGDERTEEHKDTTTKPSFLKVLVSNITKMISGEEKRTDVRDNDQLYIVECWVKDYSEKDGVPIYPGNIRKILTCNGGEVVLEDEKNPSLNWDLPEEVLQENYLYNRFPHSYVQPVPDNSSPFGLSDFEQLEKLNMELNKAMSQYVMAKDKNSRLKFVNPKDSGITNDEINNNTDGVLRPTNSRVAQGLGFIPPAQLGNDIPTALGLFKDLFNEVAGTFNDISQGQRNGAEVVAAKAIALLLEQESRMSQGKAQAYAKMLRERGRMYIALAQMWYDKPRYITFQQGNGKVTRGITGEDLRVAGKLNIVSGSTMPVSDIYKREEAKELFKAGLIDQEEILKILEIDGYQDIIKRMQQGPLGQYLQKLSIIGVPPPVLQLFQQVGKMEEKEIEKAVQMGKLPPFMQLMTQMVQGQKEPPPNPEMIKIQAENQIKAQQLQIENRKTDISEAEAKSKIQINAEKAQLEIKKLMIAAEKESADIALINEKIESEKVDRELRIQEGQIKVEGLKLDNENMRMKKAEMVAKIKQIMKNINTPESNDTDGKYDERGMVSNNEEI